MVPYLHRAALLRKARDHRAALVRKARDQRQGLQIRHSDWKDALLLFVSIRFQGLFHSPRRGAFHLSLTVLVRYRSLRST
jgi:hypothetical protein